MPNSPLTNTRIPDSTYVPDIADIMHKAIYDIEASACPRFTTTATRDTAYSAWISAGGVLADGRICYTDDAGYFARINGAWQTMLGVIGHNLVTPAATILTTASTTSTELATGLRFSVYLQVGRAYEYSSALRCYGDTVGTQVSISGRITPGSGATPVGTDPSAASDSASIETAGIAHLYPLRPRQVFKVSTAGMYTFSLWGSRIGTTTGNVSFYVMPAGTVAHQVKYEGVALSTIPVPS